MVHLGKAVESIVRDKEQVEEAIAHKVGKHEWPGGGRGQVDLGHLFPLGSHQDGRVRPGRQDELQSGGAKAMGAPLPQCLTRQSRCPTLCGDLVRSGNRERVGTILSSFRVSGGFTQVASVSSDHTSSP